MISFGQSQPSGSSVYARALNYYRTHFTDAEHNRENARQPLAIPVLALGGDAFLGGIVKQGMEGLAKDFRGGVIEHCGHWVADEQPAEIIKRLFEFFGEEVGASVDKANSVASASLRS